MRKPANGPWRVKKKGDAVGVLSADLSVVAVLPRKKSGEDTRVREAYLLAAAPELFDACCKINSILNDSLIVTSEGYRLNCSDIKKSMVDAIMRAKGYRKRLEEP